MQRGSVDLSLFPTTDVSTFYVPLDVFYLPFVFSNREHAYPVSDGPVGQGLYKDMNKKIGIRTMGMVESGFRTITTRETPVHLPKALQGLKLRLPNNPLNIATSRAIGRTTPPTSIALEYT